MPVPPEELERAVVSALQKVEVSAIISEKFAGPLPHPEHLQQYEAIQPGLADRIVTMTEKQLEHSHKMESRIVDSNLKVEARGQWFALIITMAIVGGGVYLISEGHPVSGLIPMIGAIVTLAGVFLYGRRQKRALQSGTASSTSLPDSDIPKLADSSQQEKKPASR